MFYRFTLLTAILALVAPVCLAQTRYVATTGNDAGNDCTNPTTPCEHIQYAMEQLDTGTPGTIEVALGEYTEHILIERDVTINGTLTETDTTIIQAEELPETADHSVIEIHDPHHLQINNVIIRHGVATGINDGARGGGIFNKGAASFSLTNVVFRDNHATFGGGMYNDLGSSPSYFNVVFEQNLADAAGGGLYNDVDSSPLFDGAGFQKNTAGTIGGGMYNEGNNDLTLQGVVFFQNEAAGQCGGMCLINAPASATLTNTTFTQNTAAVGAGLVLTASSPMIRDITFLGNEASNHGGGLFSMSSSPTITGAFFLMNEAVNLGGGMFNNGGSPLLLNAEFRGNSARRGGGMYNVNGAFPDLVNALFNQNQAGEIGGAMLTHDVSGASLTNASIAGNSAGDGGPIGVGGGIANTAGSSSVLLNTIVWGNTTTQGEGNEIWNDAAGSATLDFSLFGNEDGDIEAGGGFTATNSFSEAPLFVGLMGGNLTLQSASPAIETGDPNTNLSVFPGGPTNPVDLGNNPRVFNDVIDVGAYEHQGTIADEASPEALADVLTAPRPNPVRRSATFTVAVERAQDVTVGVFDALGRRVQTLYDGALAAGTSETLTLDAAALPAGLYIVRAIGEDFVRARRITVVR